MTLQISKTICLVIMFLCVYLIQRNDKVYLYNKDLIYRYKSIQSYINTLSLDEDMHQREKYENFNKLWNEICQIPYVKMVLMFWIPLKDKYWLTEEQMNFLNRTNIEQQ